MITEHLMRPGGGTLQLVADVPTGTTFKILDAINGVGCHVFVTSGPMDANVGAAAIKAAAIYAGRATDRPTRTSVEFDGIGTWLDTKLIGTIQYTVGSTATTWLNAILKNGLTIGSVSGTSGVARRYDSHAWTHRDVLDSWVGLAGVEYDIRPNFTVHVGPRTALFRSPPAVLISDGTAGPDSGLRGLRASLLDQKIAAGSVRNRMVAVGDDALLVGQAITTIPLKTHNGGLPELTDVVMAPGELQSNLATIATSTLALRQTSRREVTVSTSSSGVRSYMRPGDDVYLWGVDAGLFDGAQTVNYRGDIVSPAMVRLLSMTWPIEAGHGVFIITNSATPEVIDVTPWVAWEAPGAFMTVGDRTSVGDGAVNRSNPAQSAAIVGAPQSGSYNPTVTGAGFGPGGSCTASWWFDRGELTVEGRFVYGTSGNTLPSAVWKFSLPPGFAAVTPSVALNHGSCTFNRTGVQSEPGEVWMDSGGMRVVALSVTGSTIFHIATGPTTPHTWAVSDSVYWRANLRAIQV